MTADQQRLWEGVSVFDALDAAIALATDSPSKGGFVAALELPDRIRLQKTGSKPHHYTVWAPAEELHAAVVAVHRVER